MGGGWVDHAGTDLWGYGEMCDGSRAGWKPIGYHTLCCTKPSYEQKGYCRYVFLNDHVNHELQNDELTLQGSLTVSVTTWAYPLTGLGSPFAKAHTN